jgi:xanthine dehydrogenase YagT iron-sulfur-binding subunit
LQQAFVERDALQCGFCTSGMLVSGTALLNRGGAKGKLDRQAVQRGISGNLCRCGSYPHVVDAILQVQDARTSSKGGA